MALTIKTNWKSQDTVSPAHFNRVEGNIGSLETSVNQLDSNKVAKVSGKGLSTNDFTNAYITRIGTLETKVEGLQATSIDGSELTAERIALLFAGNDKELNATKLNNQSASYYAKATDVSGHISNKSNPHSITKAQLSLGNVNNYSDATSTEIVNGTANRYVTASAMKTAISSMKSGDSAKLNNQSASYYATATSLTSHTNSTNNPHSVTKSQVGLGSINNWATASASDIIVGSASRYVSASGLLAAISSMKSGDSTKLDGQLASYYATASNLTSHTGSNANPHNVTKAQVGLENLSNWPYALPEDVVDGTSGMYATAYAVKTALASMKAGDSGRLNGQSASYYARATLYGTGAPPSTLNAGVIYVQY